MIDLVLRERYSAADPVEASRAVQAVFGVGQIETAGGPFTFEQRSLVDDGISVTRLASRGSGVRLTATGSPDLVVILVRSGRLQAHLGDQQVQLHQNDLGLVTFSGTVELAWEDLAADFFAFPLSSFGRVLGSAEHRIMVSAPFITPRSNELAGLWRQMAQVVAGQVLDKAELYERDVVRGQLIDALAAVTVEAFGLVNAEDSGNATLEDDAMSRAETTIRSRLGESITIPDIAAAAGVSVRGLQQLYQRRYDVTPVSRLRQLRLEAADAALRNPSSGTTVGAVARRVGYSNFGRFSAHYRNQYGTSPSQTLRIARVGPGTE